eukprot:1186054-Prorocentrum_minimum.AAC.1
MTRLDSVLQLEAAFHRGGKADLYSSDLGVNASSDFNNQEALNAHPHFGQDLAGSKPSYEGELVPRVPRVFCVSLETWIRNHKQITSRSSLVRFSGGVCVQKESEQIKKEK